MELEIIKNGVIALLVLVLICWELLFPYFRNQAHKIRHIFRNGMIALFNFIVLAIFFVPLIVLVTNNPLGIFSRIMLEPYVELLFTILILDFVTYGMHVAYHKAPFMWKFHRMHHSDTEMDFSTGARFHIGEHVLSLIVRLLLYGVFAMKIEYILIYEIIFLTNVLFHHSNISIGERIDKVYRLFFTSPNMHKVHHSNKREETDTNYTSLLSVWDRLFGTYRIVENPKKIIYGIKGLEKEQSFWQMMKTPLKK